MSIYLQNDFQRPSADTSSAVRPKASHNSCMCLISVAGHPTHTLRHVRPSSLVDEKNARPEDTIRDLPHHMIAPSERVRKARNEREKERYLYILSTYILSHVDYHCCCPTSHKSKTRALFLCTYFCPMLIANVLPVSRV